MLESTLRLLFKGNCSIAPTSPLPIRIHYSLGFGSRVALDSQLSTSLRTRTCLFHFMPSALHASSASSVTWMELNFHWIILFSLINDIWNSSLKWQLLKSHLQIICVILTALVGFSFSFLLVFSSFVRLQTMQNYTD